jgi:endonuclease YncB( thermonuclease family)
MVGRLIFSVVAAAAMVATAHAQRWETLVGCRLLPHDWNDGDSFHVMHNGREYIFRLCYVDAPETKDQGLTERTSEQARYWKIRKGDLYPLATEAAAFVADELKGGFTVRTQWVDAKGQSHLGRHYAVIETARGDLAELLVAHGLARVYGFSPEHPNGTSPRDYQGKLKQLEARAKEASKGAWAYSGRKSPPKPKASSPRPTPTPKKSGMDAIPAF